MSSTCSCPHVARRAALTRLRTPACSTNEQEIEQGRHRGLPRAQPLCTVCGQQEVEDERNLKLACSAHAHERGRMVCGVYMATNGAIVLLYRALTSNCAVCWVPGTGIDDQMRRRCRIVVTRYVMVALRERTEILPMRIRRRPCRCASRLR